MKRPWVCAVTVLLVLGAVAGPVVAQSEAGKIKLSFGPRVGATFVIMDPGTYNASMQALFPAPEMMYFPLFVQMGIGAQQLVPLGESKSSLVFQELFLLGGLDQNLFMPNLNLILGYRRAAGIEFGMGPYITIAGSGSDLKLSASVVYMLGWTVAAKGFSVPITITMVPIPSYLNPRLSLLVGFQFEVLE